MSLRGTDASPEKDTPAPEPSPEEPSEEVEQPDQEQDGAAEAEPPAPDKADETDADQAADREKAEAEPTDWKKKYDDTEKKRRDIESDRDQLRNRIKEVEGVATTTANWWRNLVREHAPELYEKVTDAERKAGEGNRQVQQTKDSSMAVIARVYREGDKGFGDFLTTLVEDSDVRVSFQSLERHRKTYEALRGTQASDNGKGAGEAAPARTGASATPAAGGSSSPPRVPAAGRTPTDVGAAPWKPGEPFDVRGNLSRGLADSARRRQQTRR
jgi:chromosome segregation ATPase